MERHFSSLCDLCLFSLSFLFTEVSEEECLFVDSLAQSAAIEDTSEAMFVKKKTGNVKILSFYWTEILTEFLRL